MIAKVALALFLALPSVPSAIAADTPEGDVCEGRIVCTWHGIWGNSGPECVDDPEYTHDEREGVEVNASGARVATVREHGCNVERGGASLAEHDAWAARADAGGAYAQVAWAEGRFAGSEASWCGMEAAASAGGASMLLATGCPLGGPS